MGAKGDNGRRGEVPWWGLVTSVCAPILLVLGWTGAAALQPGGSEAYDWIRQTVSVLATPDASDPWAMSLTFLVVGFCDVVTGLALRPAARPGRIALISGAIGGMLVAANPAGGGRQFGAACVLRGDRAGGAHGLARAGGALARSRRGEGALGAAAGCRRAGLPRHRRPVRLVRGRTRRRTRSAWPRRAGTRRIPGRVATDRRAVVPLATGAAGARRG